MLSVPVVDYNQTPLMPTIPSRARRWIKSGKATPFWKNHVFCVRLNVEPSDCKMQDIAVGIDPGSKKEALTIKSKAHTYLNVQTDAVTWVGRHVETRRIMRRSRRNRKTPHRANRTNRKGRGLPPSTKARWQLKLRLARWLRKIFPITTFVVEDIKAKSRPGKHGWNRSFSPLQAGKTWFYEELGKIAQVVKKSGWDTFKLREKHGLPKAKDKLSPTFYAHCIDSWVLANEHVGGHDKPKNTNMLLLRPLQFHRRQLHVLQPSKNGIRKRYGGTLSLGFKRGSLVKHVKHGLSYIGGYLNDRLCLHSVSTGQRLCQNAKSTDCTFVTFNYWARQLLLAINGKVSVVFWME